MCPSSPDFIWNIVRYPWTYLNLWSDTVIQFQGVFQDSLKIIKFKGFSRPQGWNVKIQRFKDFSRSVRTLHVYNGIIFPINLYLYLFDSQFHSGIWRCMTWRSGKYMPGLWTEGGGSFPNKFCSLSLPKRKQHTTLVVLYHLILLRVISVLLWQVH